MMFRPECSFVESVYETTRFSLSDLVKPSQLSNLTFHFETGFSIFFEETTHMR